jgi:hypothetical protein
MQEGSCKSRRPPFQDISFFRPNRLSSPHDLIVSNLQHDDMVANFRMKVNFPLRSMNSKSKERELLLQRVSESFISPSLPYSHSQCFLLTLLCKVPHPRS